jgi:hypothetical protein
MAYQTNRRRNSFWPKYIIELFVIISGITISFMLQNWQESKKLLKAEQALLERIYNDLVEDTLALTKEYESIQEVIDRGVLILEFPELKTIDRDSVNRALLSQLQYSYFFKTDIGYQTIKAGNASNVLRNTKLFNQIIRLYAISYRELDEYCTIDKTFIIEELIPYYNHNFPYVENYEYMNIDRRKLLSLMKDDRFKNLVKTNMLFKGIILSIQKRTIDDIKQVMESIQKEMDHPI